MLVRTGGYGRAKGSGDRRSWLLIKHRDEWSGELDITEFAPKSVKSDGDFEDILAEDTPAVWVSNKPARPAQWRRRRRHAREDHRARRRAEGGRRRVDGDERHQDEDSRTTRRRQRRLRNEPRKARGGKAPRTK